MRKTTIIMYYDINEDEPVIRKLYKTDYDLDDEEKNEIMRHIRENLNRKKIENIANEVSEDTPLVKIGVARINGGLNFENRKYELEGSYEFASGYPID